MVPKILGHFPLGAAMRGRVFFCIFDVRGNGSFSAVIEVAVSGWVL